MKTTFYAFTLLIALLIFSCSDDNNTTDNDDSNNIENINIQGHIVFQENLTRMLRTAEINSWPDSKSFGTASNSARPIWSNDGTKFAVIELISSEDPSSNSVFAVKVVNMADESTEIWEIGSSDQVSLRGPLTWSPDGNTIAVLTNQIDQKIIYLNTTTGDTTQTELLLDVNETATALAWQPNSNKIAVNIIYTQNFQSNNTLWMIEPFGTTPSNTIALESESIGIEHMDYNNNGTMLLLSHSTYDAIYVLDINSGQFKEIANANGLAPCWSRDGKYILYTGISGLNGSTIIPGLILTDIEGSFEQTLVTDARLCDWY